MNNFLLSKHVSLTQRVKLAQELHDGIAQDLVGLGYCIDSLLALEERESTRRQLRELRFDLNTLITKIRGQILELRSSQELSDPLNLHSDLRTNLNHIFNELITNSINHSCASHIQIQVSDNGIGGLSEKAGHHGIQGIHERVDSLGGELLVDSDFTGTSVTIKIALEKA